MSGVAGRVYVHLGYGHDVRMHSCRFAQGLVCDASPYDFHLARAFGWAVSFSEDMAENTLVKFFRRGFAYCLGFDGLHAYRNRQRMLDCDIIWTMSEREWLSVAMLQAFRVIPKRRMIGNSIWLFDRWRRLLPFKKRLYRILSDYCTILTVHSNACIPVAKAAFPKSNIQLMYFGISTSTFPITSPAKPASTGPRRRILAIGKDKTRDWKTVVTAFGNDPLFDLVLVCKWVPKKYERLYINLMVKRSVTGKEFAENYTSSDIVVISMHENLFSGITVLLEAVASGTPVIASRTGGCPTYFDEDEVTYVPCGDPAQMRNAAMDFDKLREKAKGAQGRFLNRDYSTDRLIERYSDLTRDILALETGAIRQFASRELASEPQERKLTPSRW